MWLHLKGDRHYSPVHKIVHKIFIFFSGWSEGKSLSENNDDVLESVLAKRNCKYTLARQDFIVCLSQMWSIVKRVARLTAPDTLFI